MDRKTLQQYMDLKAEVEQVRGKIAKLEDELVILRDEMVQDKVKGGIGGWQSFTIEGFPSAEYSKKKNLLIKRAGTLRFLENKIDTMLNSIEEYIASVDDSYMRRIIDLRVVQGMEWHDVAKVIGGGNSDDGVKKYFYRYLERGNQGQK